MWALRLPSVAPVSFLSFENSSPVLTGMAFSAAMIRRRSGWWMTSSSSAIASVPPHPEPAEHEPAAVDHRHPQQEGWPDVVVADQRQGGRADPGHDECVTEPQAGKRIKQHAIDDPEHE